MNNDECMPFPCIIDFGHAQILEPDEDNNYYGNPHSYEVSFSAPEVIMKNPCSFSADIFSLGATFYFLITGDLIPRNLSPGLRINSIENFADLPFVNKFGPRFPLSGIDLIKSMLNADPNSRPTANQILQSDFFRENVMNDQNWVNDEENFRNT